MQQKLILSFLDKVAPKNKLQIDIIHQAGFRAGFFVTSYHTASEDYFVKGDIYQPLKSGFVDRLLQIFSFLLKYRKQIHHIEVYPGGRFSFIYVLLAKMFFFKVICVERGDLCHLISRGYDRLTRFSMRLCYRWSDLIWYREVYMNKILSKMGYAHKLFFLHNAVENDLNFQINEYTRDIDFLWVNRLIPERKSDWVVDILCQQEFKETNNVMAGFLLSTRYNIEQQYVLKKKPDNLKVINFIDTPSDLYKRAKFFLLPATFVFANNALLEAMSYGCVPIITEAPGSDLIVVNGVNGFVAQFNKQSLNNLMLNALQLDNESFKKLCNASRSHIINKFSPDIYKEKLIELYQLIKN